ncbi:MAG: hypothetical protein D6753_04250 [Planctomycetota bacterium]|nr:MAG: hypothetical protein D6753_04250 [Planctomycetota bacterium]
MNPLLYVPDLVFVALVVGVAMWVARFSLVQATLLLLGLLLASLGAIVTFEPLAEAFLRWGFGPADVDITRFFWFISGLSVFALLCLCFAIVVQPFFDALPELSGRAAAVAKWMVSILAGYLFAAFLLTLTYTLPVDRDMGGILPLEAHLRHGPIVRMAPDYQFLSLAEWVTGRRSPWTGQPWRLGGPLANTDIYAGRWESFPARYALWRDMLKYFFAMTDPEAYSAIDESK